MSVFQWEAKIHGNIEAFSVGDQEKLLSNGLEIKHKEQKRSLLAPLLARANVPGARVLDKEPGMSPPEQALRWRLTGPTVEGKVLSEASVQVGGGDVAPGSSTNSRLEAPQSVR